MFRKSKKRTQLNKFVNNILGPYDDITRFEYIKTNKDYGHLFIGIHVSEKYNIDNIENNLIKYEFNYKNSTKMI